MKESTPVADGVFRWLFLAALLLIAWLLFSIFQLDKRHAEQPKLNIAPAPVAQQTAIQSDIPPPPEGTLAYPAADEQPMDSDGSEAQDNTPSIGDTIAIAPEALGFDTEQTFEDVGVAIRLSNDKRAFKHLAYQGKIAWFPKKAFGKVKQVNDGATLFLVHLQSGDYIGQDWWVPVQFLAHD